MQIGFLKPTFLNEPYLGTLTAKYKTIPQKEQL